MKSEALITRGCNCTKADLADVHSCCGIQSNKLDVYNWLADIDNIPGQTDLVEIRFKNTRKGIYKNVNGLTLFKGDIVAVEASPGHDIGIVSLTGELVLERIRRGRMKAEAEYKKIYRKAKTADTDKWREAMELEEPTMLKARVISDELKLNMKIGDVEYQGDRTKAIFYYIADDRVDFRELIKVLAEEFKVRIEMRQIGARQEAGRIGGIASCGRELCCSTFITNFVSVSTNAARYQEVSLNPQKLAGQCGKLKCCLNYELDSYLDAQKDFPEINGPIETSTGIAYHQKTDVYRRIMWFSYKQDASNEFIALSVEQVKDIVEANKKGKKPLIDVKEEKKEEKKTEFDYKNVIGEDSLTRFEEKRNRAGNQPQGNRPNGFQRNDRNNRPNKSNRPFNRDTDNRPNNGN